MNPAKIFKPENLEADLTRKAIKYLTWNSPGYPRYLLEIAQPPPVLYYIGEILPEDDRAVAIVGTRNVTRYGKQITHDTAAYLAGSGITVVSGLARGVDGIAHQAAIEAGGSNLCCPGLGVDVIYPLNIGNLRDITQHGA